MEAVRFALLGLGAGAAYALVGQGLVLVYRGAGIINFAQGAIGMVCAYWFFQLHDSVGLPLALALLVALAAAAATGAAIHIAVMRPLANAAALARVMSTLALLVLLLTWLQHQSNSGVLQVRSVLPSGTVQVFTPRLTVGRDNLIEAGIAVVITAVLTIVYRRTRFGLATSAVAENSRSAGALGISPDRVAALNWVIASVISAIGAIMLCSLESTLVPATIALIVLPGLAAALAADFRSFPLALVAGLGIGIIESEFARYVSDPGWSTAVPFLIIIVVLVVRGQPLPLRGETAERASRLGDGVFRPKWALVAAGVFVAIWLVPVNTVAAITTTVLAAMIILSLVVVTGFAGQLSLAQYTLAGVGAFTAGRLIATLDLPFELAMLAGIAATVGVGLLIGLVSLRSRGVNLAIATLGAGLAIEQVVLLPSTYTGGLGGTKVPDFRFFGIHLDEVHHPAGFSTFVFGVLLVLVLVVANLRRSTAGRRLIAMRANERAAASLGVSVFGAKLYAFAFSSAIAAIGGMLLAFRANYVTFDAYTVFESITAVLQGVVGGIGYVSGIIIGGLLHSGSVTEELLNQVFKGSAATYVLALLGGFGALYILIRRPDGLAAYKFHLDRPLEWLTRLVMAPITPLVRRLRRGPVSDESVPMEPVPPGTLEIHDLTVVFGGVVALRDARLSVGPGEIVGLIGPNGSGKTTLIDAVTGFVAPSSGTILLSGVEMRGTSAVRRSRAGLGRTFQALELFGSMTVADNLHVAADPHRRLAYFTGLVRPGKQPLGPMALGAARALGLEKDLDRKPDDLPFGRRRLAAIARAIAARPSVLMLDEPAAGLGQEQAKELGVLLRQLATQIGLAILLVEHDVGLVAEVCDRLVVLDRGHVIAQGEPTGVLSDPEVQLAYLGETGRGAAEPVTVPCPVMATASSNGNEPVLAARALRAGYGSLAAVRDLYLSVHRGEVVALLGPNGAGKTTTILTLAGAIAPLDGQVLWEGKQTKDALHRRAQKGLGLVTEERSVFMGLSTEANLRLGRGNSEDALEIFPQLRALLGRRAGLLSGGEQQMLTLARAMAAKPKALLVDELSLGLAPIVVGRLFGVLREIADSGVGVLVVEQYAQRALEIADRVYVLNRGSVVLDAPASTVRADPDLLRRSYLEGAEALPVFR